MFVRRGITGMKYPDSASIDEKRFVTLCYELCRALNYGSVKPDFGATARSFDAVEIEKGDGESLVVLLHVNFNLLCFASTIEPFNVEFIDDTKCKDFFRPRGFEVLSKTELDVPFALLVSHGLSDDEEKEINYWKPRTFGELAFNFWD